ncbi:MAG: hypothetical protein IPF99_32280 [Deltaproteobacteria bacterium]|nr:hypothetical protein [Deltaproteobacteria bacterium]
MARRDECPRRPGGAVQRFPSEHLRGVQEAHIAATARNGWVFALGRGGDHAVINVRSGERRDIAFAVPQGMRRVHLPGVERGPDDAWDISITTGEARDGAARQHLRPRPS